ncbi:unnamed protein product, partial [Ectocarpus fasciculatus]
EKVLGPDHPSLATTLHNRAGLLEKQGKQDRAVVLLERALSIRMTALGDNHRDTVATQNAMEQVLKQ